MEKYMRLSKAAAVIVALALVVAIAVTLAIAAPSTSRYVPSEESADALSQAAPAEDGTVSSGYQVDVNATGISDIGTLRNATTGNYYLTQDIQVNSFDNDKNYDNIFSGTFDGNGHTITIDAAVSEADSNDVGGLLMGLGSGATIKNLTIVVNGFRYGTTADTNNVGIIAGYASQCTIENVRVVLNHSTSSTTANNMDNYVYMSSQPGESGDVEVRLGGLFGKVESGTAIIRNVTVENNAGGQGFSVLAWLNSGGFFDHSDSLMRIGGFVGHVLSSGGLDMDGVTYKTGDGTGKIAAIGESTSNYRYNLGHIGGIIGYLDNGNVDINGLHLDVKGTVGEMFTGININYDDGFQAGIVVGQKDNDGNLNMSGILVNDAANLGNGVVNQDEYLIGNDGMWSGRTEYPDNAFADVRFVIDGNSVTPYFAVELKAPDQYASVISAITQHKISSAASGSSADQEMWRQSDMTSQFVAKTTSEVGTLSWITLPQLVMTGSDDHELRVVQYSSSQTYTISNYDTISSVSGNVYIGSKGYDGTSIKTPQINIGGNVIYNAWTADSSTADVGTKNFTYNANALSGYTQTEYNGATYFISGSTIYAPGNITVGGSGQQLILTNGFSYEITTAQITSVTATVDYDVLFPDSQKPTLQLVSVTPNVSGTLAWDDEPLEVGKTTYGWTFTPDNANYSTYHGTTELVVSDVVIERIEVTTDPNKTVYTAYDAFDPSGMVVTAYYSAQGVTSVLGNDEYTLEIANGDISRLLVANNTVTVKYNADPSFTDTIAITVEPRRIAVPTAATGLVYNGQQQTGVTAEGTYYTVSGNTATDAGDYTATASLNDVINTVWDNASSDTTAKQISWSIAPYAVTIGTSSVTSKTYDGEAVDPAGLFTAPNGVNGEGALALAITVDGGKTLLDADTYTIVAALADNVANENYTATQAQITYKIDKVVLDGTLAFGSAVYDGAAKDATFELTEGNTVGSDKIVVTYGGESDRTNVTGRAVTATAVLPSPNYEWAGAAPSASVTIEAMRVEIGAVDTLTKDYDGTETDAAELFVAPVGADDAELALTIVVEDGKTILNAGSYKVTASLDAGANYVADDKAIVFTIAKKIVVAPTVDEEQTFTYNGDVQTFIVAASADGSYTVEGNTATNAGNYTVTVSLVDTLNTEWNDSTGSAPKTYGWSIAQAVPVVDAQLSAPADLTTADTLDNAWLSRGSNSDGVPGSLAWTNAGALLAEGENEYEWTFSPTDTLNYEIVSGTFKVTAKLDTIVSIAVKDGTYKAVYTAFENFDPTGMIIVAHYESGKETEVTAGYTLAGNESLRYGQDGRAEVTVTLNGVSDTVVVTVERIVVAVPTAVTGLVYSGQQQTGVVDGDGYTMSGNTAATAGPHEATATLDSTDYVWTDGSVDPKNVTWTIAKVQITVASTDIGVKQIEYGSGYSWNASEFFTATAVNSDAFVVGVAAADGAVDLTAANIGNYTAGIKVVVYAQDSLVDDETLALNFDVQDVSALKMEVKIIAAKVTVTFAADDQPTEYNGEKVSFAAIRDNFTLSTGVEVDILVDGVAYNDADITNADDYEITIVSLDDNYELVGDTTVTFTIEKGEPYIAATLNIVGTVYSSETLNTVKMKLSSGYEDSTPGTFSWAPDQDLIVGDYEYEWIFTPDDTANYKIATGKFVITVVQATLTSISVSAPTRTEYFAYDAFDKSSITVTASYEDGSTKQVHNYSVILSSGTADALVAGENISVSVVYRDGDIEQSVNDAFVINVARLALTVPTLSGGPFVYDGEEKTVSVEQSDRYSVSGTLTATEVGEYNVVLTLTDPVNTEWADGTIEDKTLIWNINEPVTVNEVIEAINAMDEVVWSNALEFKALAEEYALLDASEIPAETAAKFATLQAQYDALCEAATSDIENAQKVTAKAAGRAVAAAGLAAAAIVAAILKRRFI